MALEPPATLVHPGHAAEGEGGPGGSHLLPWFTQDMLQRVRWVQDAMSAASWVG